MICDSCYGKCEKINRAFLPKSTFLSKAENEQTVKEFCKLIPKKDGMENPLTEKKKEHINWFANDFQESKENKELAELDEKELQQALKNELQVFRYLMSKHKNSRALVFYNSIFIPTYEALSAKLMTTLGSNYQEEEEKNKYDKTEANNKRVQEQKKFLDSIKKGKNAFNEQFQNLVDNFSKAFTAEGNRRNKYLQDLCDGADLIKYAIDKHRHQRGINFTYVYEKIINDTINNVHKNAGIQK